MTSYTSFSVISAGNPINKNSGTSTLIGDASSNGTPVGTGTLDLLGTLFIGPDPSDAVIAYNLLIDSTPDQTSNLADISGTTWIPGIIQLSSATEITMGSDPVTLNGAGSYFFQVPNTSIATVPSGVTWNMNLIDGALPSLVFWFVNGNASLQTIGGAVTNFPGTILAQGNIVMGPGSICRGTLVGLSESSTVILNGNSITSNDAQALLDTVPASYAILQSNLSDSQAVQINALNVNGGVSITSGFGGIGLDSTNSINLRAVNASSFVVSGSGNLDLRADVGLVNIDGVGGVNIGLDPTNVTGVVNIGNAQASTSVNLAAGTGGIHANTSTGGAISLHANGAVSNFSVVATGNSQDLILSMTGAHDSSIILTSTGTGTDAISLTTSAGGVNVSSATDVAISSSTAINLVTTGALVETANGTVTITSTANNANAISLSTAFGGGGVSVFAGNLGIVLNAHNGSATNGPINLSAGGPGVSINAYNGGGVGLGNFSGGEVFIGTAAVSRILHIGNSTGTTSVINHWGDGGVYVLSQTTESVLGTSSAETALFASLLSRIIVYSPTAPATLTLDTAVAIVAGLNSVIGAASVNDSIEFSVINGSAAATSVPINVVPGAGGIIIGNGTVLSATDTASTPIASGSGWFRLRITSIGTGTEAYVVYRVA